MSAQTFLFILFTYHHVRLPTSEKIRFKLLEFAKDGDIRSIHDAENYLAKTFGLTKEQRKKEKSTGRETIFLHKIRWCRTYLRIAGLISDPEKAHYKITDLGEKFLKENPNLREMTKEHLLTFEDFKTWWMENEAQKKRRRIEKKPIEGNGVIIMIDALGTKGIHERIPSRRITETWRNFTTDLKNKIELDLSSDDKFTFHSFSDTIIVAIVTKKIDDVLYKISRIFTKFIIESMVIDRPIRGCISIGPIIMDDIQVVGDAIKEASEYFELPQWIGISACPSAHHKIEELQEKDSKKTDSHFQPFDLPLRNSIELGALAINWTEPANEDVSYYAKIHGRKEYENIDIYDFFRKKSENSRNLGIVSKWRNALRFFTEVRK